MPVATAASKGQPLRASHRTPTLPQHLQATLSALLAGKRNREIADELCLALHTVENYVSELLTWHAVSSRTQLILLLLDRPVRGPGSVDIVPVEDRATTPSKLAMTEPA
ncbi:MAG: LuxR C-terminal-related transcriptional regulator [Dehalococcoidia bacterium]